MTNKHFVIITAILIALASQRAELSFAQPGGRPGGGPGARNAQKIEYKGATSYNADVETRDQTYASENAEELALLVTSGVAKVTNSTIVKSGDPSGRNDSYDFYEKEGDENSCILKITNPKRFWNTSDVLIIMLK